MIDETVESEVEKLAPPTRMLIVNPMTKSVISMPIAGWRDIKAQFGSGAEIDGGVLCRLQAGIWGAGEIMLGKYVDCNQFEGYPGWYTSFNKLAPLHGLVVIDAADNSNGEPIDCPITPEEFIKTIVWEDWQSRIDPTNPNKGWLKRFGTGWGFAGEPRYYNCEEA